MIYNGIPLPPAPTTNNKVRNELDLHQSTLVVGMIGRVSYWKGQDYFIRISHELLKHDGEVKFIMVGDVYPGNEHLYDELTQLKQLLGVTNSIFDLGYRRDIPDILSALDLFILPSTLPDPFPTVILEAMGQGKAIVATRHGGALEMLEENVSGAFIPINDEKAASTIIFSLLKQKKLRTEMGIQARKRVSNDFSSAKFKKKIIATIEHFQIK